MKHQAAEAGQNFIPMSQQEFEVILREHELWMRSDGQEGKRGNFRDADLRGCLLAGANLVGASLRGSCMAGMDLSKTVLQEVDMAEANLSGIKADGADFQRANLSNAKLDMASLVDADISFANMLACDLSGANLERVTLVQTSMRETQLASVNLERANLSQAILRGAVLTDANLTGANLEHADMRETKCVRTRFDGANLRETMLRGAELEGVSFIDVDFSHAVDVAPQYQMIAFQQRQEALAEEKREIVHRKAELAEREAATLNDRREVERKIDLYHSLREEEEALCSRLAAYALRAGMFALIWVVAVAVMGLGIALIAASIPSDKLNIVEITALFGVLLALLALFVVSALLPRHAAKLIKKHVALRERKQSPLYNEGMEKSHSVASTGLTVSTEGQQPEAYPSGGRSAVPPRD